MTKTKKIDRARGGKADPVRDDADIGAIYRDLCRNGKQKWAEVFIIGCNCALRASDLFSLKREHIIREDVEGRTIGRIRDSVLREKKTSKRKSLIINHAGMEAFDRMCNLWPDDEYLAQTERNQVGTALNPVTITYFNRCLRESRDRLGLQYRLSTHSMRKTFGYHAFRHAKKKDEVLIVLQRLFQHSSPLVTMEYIGITQERVDDLYISTMIGLDI